MRSKRARIAIVAVLGFLASDLLVTLPFLGGIQMPWGFVHGWTAFWQLMLCGLIFPVAVALLVGLLDLASEWVSRGER